MSDHDKATYFHGTKANLEVGMLIAPGFSSNFGSRRLSNHVYFSTTLDAATWGAELAIGEGPERIYLVEPLGPFEDDPNLTDKKFPGNPTKSYWVGHEPELLQTMSDNVERMRLLGV